MSEVTLKQVQIVQRLIDIKPEIKKELENYFWNDWYDEALHGQKDKIQYDELFNDMLRFLLRNCDE